MHMYRLFYLLYFHFFEFHFKYIGNVLSIYVGLYDHLKEVISHSKYNYTGCEKIVNNFLEIGLKAVCLKHHVSKPSIM